MTLDDATMDEWDRSSRAILQRRPQMEKQEIVTNTAELIVRAGNLHRQVQEESAKGFTANSAALALVYELKDAVKDLEGEANAEYLGGGR